MATYTVQAPDGKTITLQGPDGASQSDVITQAQRLYTPQEKPSLASDAVKYSPVGIVNSLADAIRDPKHALAGLLAQPSENAKLLEKAKDSYKSGDYTGAAAHFLNYLIPGGGALDDAGEDFRSGDTARGLAKTAGIASTMVAAGKAPEVLDRITEPAAPSSGSLTGKIAQKVVAKIAAAKGVPPGVVNAIFDALKTGESEAPAVRPSNIAIPALRDRPPLRVPDTEAPAAPDASPIQSPLPSGRLPGGIQNQVATPPAVAPPAANAELLDAISRDQAGKPFAKLTPAGQATVRLIAQHVEAEPATQPPPVVSQPVAVAPAPPAPTAIITKADIAKRALAEEMLKSGSATPEMLGDPGGQPVVPDAAALKTIMRDLPPGGPKAIANANYAGNQEPAQAAAVYEAAGRATKSQALSQMLYDEGLSSTKVARWSQKAWDAATNDRGLPTAFSKESQGEVIQMLRKLEKTVPK